MKKNLSLALLVLLSFFFVACEQRNKGLLPQEITLENFKTMYPHARSIKWKMDKGYHVVEFRDAGHDKYAWYSVNGIWLLTETEYKRKAPAVIKDAVGKVDSGWHINNVSLVEVKDKDSFYVVEVKKGDREINLFFSENGEFLLEGNEDSDYRPTPVSVL